MNSKQDEEDSIWITKTQKKVVLKTELKKKKIKMSRQDVTMLKYELANQFALRSQMK